MRATTQPTLPQVTIWQSGQAANPNLREDERRLIWAVCALLLILYAFLTPMLFAYRAWPFDSDEATHAVEGLQAAADLRGGHFAALASDLYFHYWYPPILSVYLSPFLAIMGPQYWAARYPLLLMFLVGLALLYRVGRLLWRQWEIGVVVILLGATSPVCWLCAVMCLEESLAMVMLLITIASYVLAARGRLRWFWPGIALAVTFLCRTTMGGFLAGAFLLAHWCCRGGWKAKALATVQSLAPLVLVVFLWLAHPYKLYGAIDYFLSSSPQQSTLTWYLFVRYWDQLFSTYTGGWVVGIIVILSVLLSFRRWAEPAVRLLLVLLLVTWLILFFKRQVDTRLFFAASLPAFPLAALQFVTLLKRARQLLGSRLRWLYRLSVAGFALYFVAAVIVRLITFPFLLEVLYETDRDAEQWRSWITQRADAGTIFLVNAWDQFSAASLNWHLAAEHWPRWDPKRVVAIDLYDPAKKPSKVTDFQEAVLAAPENTIVFLGNTPVPAAGAWWAYRAALTSCWDGEWEEGVDFWIKIWDGQLGGEILAHPTRFLRRTDQEAARQAFWYSLLVEMRIAHCGD